MSVPSSLRAAVEFLDQSGGLTRVSRPVDPVGELTGVVSAMEDSGLWSAALFESIKGYDDWRVVSLALRRSAERRRRCSVPSRRSSLHN